VLIGCYCSINGHMFTDISHPRIGVLGLLIPRIAVLGFLDIVRFKLHFKVHV
jgi:hypothetical protein